MSDMISRADAIEAICEHGTDLERRGITVLAVANHKQITVDLLENLPSAERTGKWVDDKGKPYNGKPNDSCWCSECGEWLVASDEYSVSTNFCPNCGAKMEGGE